MRVRTMAATVACALLVAGCGGETQSATASAAGTVTEWVLPAPPGSSAPGLTLAPDGRLLVSWLNQPRGRRPALQFAALNRDGAWQSPPRTVAVGNSLVVNWADTPHMLATPDGALWMQWLQRTGEGARYDVALVRSRDGGMQWSEPAKVNDSEVAAEYGFAALWPSGQDALGIAWLDGRSLEGSTHDGGHVGGDMQLRTARFDMELSGSGHASLDMRTCECCQVAVAMTARGPVLAYRDRGNDEVRDIVTVRGGAEGWSRPAPVHADGWKTESCPVNGPALAAQGETALVAWYTEAGGSPKVQLARSTNAGDGFGAPVQVDAGAAVLGRVAVAMDAGQAWVAWLREDAPGQSLQLARYAPDLSRKLQQVEVARLRGRGHATGFPRLAARDGDAWLAWTDTADGEPDVFGARVSGGR